MGKSIQQYCFPISCTNSTNDGAGLTQTEDRKDDHLQIIQERDVETTGTGFDDVHLVHNALPELDYDAIDPPSTSWVTTSLPQSSSRA